MESRDEFVGIDLPNRLLHLVGGREEEKQGIDHLFEATESLCFAAHILCCGGGLTFALRICNRRLYGFYLRRFIFLVGADYLTDCTSADFAVLDFLLNLRSEFEKRETATDECCRLAEFRGYLTLRIAELISESLEHQGLLIFREILSLVAHHLFDEQVFLFGIAREEDCFDSGYLCALFDCGEGCPHSSLSVHETVFLVAVLIFERHDSDRIENALKLDLLFEFIESKFLADIEVLDDYDIAGVYGVDVGSFGTIKFANILAYFRD